MTQAPLFQQHHSDSRAILESLLGGDAAMSSSDSPEVPGPATALCVADSIGKAEPELCPGGKRSG